MPCLQREAIRSRNTVGSLQGKNIFDVLEMDVSEALEFFESIPSIKHKLETLQRVGMDYIKLGQSSTTLSGGEAQRIKLAKELVRPATDAPSTYWTNPRLACISMISSTY